MNGDAARSEVGSSAAPAPRGPARAAQTPSSADQFFGVGPEPDAPLSDAEPLLTGFPLPEPL